jgi:restriction endonuclease S subunit
MGPFGSNITADNFVNSGVPVIQGRQLNSLFLEEVDYRFLTPQKAESLKNSKAKKRDIVITHRGTIGQVGIIPDDSEYDEYIVSQSQLKFTVDENICDPFFVYYFLRSYIGQYELLKNTTSVGVPAIAMPTASVKKINIPFPKLSIQQKISTNLKIIDLQILNNRKIQKKLQTIMSSIFRSWFIDFDPVKAKVKHQLPYGMDEKTAALFPNSFEDSELGQIPAGWNWGTLLDISKIWTGGTPKTSESSYWGGDIPWVSGADLSSNELFAFDSSRKITSLGVEKSSTKILPVGTVMITARGTVGATKITAVPMAMSQTSFGFKAKEGVSDALIYQASQETIRQLRSYAYGAVFDTFTQSTIDITKISIAPLEILQAFGKMVDPLFEQLKNSAKTQIELANTRNALLPRLMSGELKVS